MERDKKRDFQNLHDNEHDYRPSETSPKRTSNSIPTPGSEVEYDIIAHILSLQLLPHMRAAIRPMVSEEFDRKFMSYVQFLPSSSSSTVQLNNHNNEETTNFRLCFLNQIPSTIFTNNEIETGNGDALQVALIDDNNSNAIVSDGPLSIAQIEVSVLDGDSDKFMSQNILSPRDGKRPLIVGDDLKLHLKNGVGFIQSLSFTDNSSWVRSKQFRLGLRIVDDKIQMNQKHHPPQREDEIWRLERIGRNGVYHKLLSSQGINTVGDFLRTYEKKGPLYLRKLLGKNVSNKSWNAMVTNALECIPLVKNFAPSFERQDLFEYEGMGSEGFEGNLEVIEQRNSSDWNKFLETTLEEWDPNMQEASTSHKYNYEVEDPYKQTKGRGERQPTLKRLMLTASTGRPRAGGLTSAEAARR
ncbi:calmodulin-binding protein 60 B-like [Cucumis melo var. makuwa]|uniref:Calmodulin-binding protein 60 B-like n=1 Tax=Cucumis melo var. makuwa TaxID=1194695 RepID=A0A5A7U6W5_CUCMM|nr:calmodulin-binding protein 60 B-like [Cucumis melo var. makuwa]